MSRWRVLAPWVLFALAVVLIVGSGVAAELLADRLPRDTGGFDGWVGYLWLASWLGFPLVGAVVASRRRTVIGWLLLGMGVGIGLAIAASGWLSYEVSVRGRTPGALVLALTSAAAAPAFGLAPFAIDRFPSDEAPRGRWRLVVRTAAAVLAVVVVALVTRPTISHEAGRTFENPLAVPALGTLPDGIIVAGALALVGFFLAVVVRTVSRFRRSNGVERAQLKWFVSSLCVFPLLFAVVLLSGDRLPPVVADALVAVAFFVSFNGMAAAIGIAILRYRLFEIDRIVSRTVSYVAVSAVLLVVYLLGILVSQTVLASVVRGSDLGVALSTLVAAALFQPVRRRVQGVVDRRFNRARYDAQGIVAAFSAAIRDEIQLADLAHRLRSTAEATVEPATVGIWLRPSEVTR